MEGNMHIYWIVGVVNLLIIGGIATTLTPEQIPAAIVMMLLVGILGRETVNVNKTNAAIWLSNLIIFADLAMVTFASLLLHWQGFALAIAGLFMGVILAIAQQQNRYQTN